MDLIPVEGEKHLYRDSNTNAIVNTNNSDYSSYIIRRKIQEDEKDRINNLEKDVSSIKGDLNEIKTLLRSLANGS
jgi:hypothetical protein|tara:strand:- start:366 stop:590 length:225 start_codon:yes stop_codon:yes gene_type:complete